jgi:hypothetical protein
VPFSSVLPEIVGVSNLSPTTGPANVPSSMRTPVVGVGGTAYRTSQVSLHMVAVFSVS